MTDPTADSAAGRQAKFFISYARTDVAFADRLAASLRSRGFDALIDRSDIYAFEDWWRRIEELIVRSDGVVFVLSPAAIASEICAREIALAASLNKRLAPIVLHPVDDRRVPEQLRRLNFIFFDEPAVFEGQLNKLADALSTDIDWVRKHTEFGEAARRWSAAGRPGPRGLLLRSPALEDAERWIASRPAGAPTPTEETQTFIAESRRAATRRRNIVTAGLGVGFALALGLAGLAYWQRGVAIEQRQIAQGNEAQANEQRDRALLTQSRFLAGLAEQRSAAGDRGQAVLLALEALSNDQRRDPRPYAPQAEAALFDALRHLQETAVWSGPTSRITSLSFGPDGLSLAAAYNDKTARIWDVPTGRIATILSGHTASLFGVAYSPDGSRIITAAQDNTARIWDAKSGKQLMMLTGHNGFVFTAVYSHDGHRILTASYDKTARIWDADTGDLIAILFGHTDFVFSADYSPDDRHILTSSLDKTARIWDAETFQLVLTIEAGTVGRTGLQGASYSPDGKFVVGGVDNDARVWDAETGKLVRVLVGHTATTSGEFGSNGRSIFTTSHDETSRIWDVASGRTLAVLAGHTSFVTAAKSAPDDRYVVTASDDGTIRFWSAQPPQTDIVLRHNDVVRSAVFSPDGQRILTGCADKVASIWNVSTGQLMMQLLGHLSAVTGAAFSHDGKLAATASSDKTVRVWDITTGETIRTLQGHSSPVLSVAFSPDDRQLITASTDKTARLWNVETGETIRTFSGHTEIVADAEFSPDGRRIVTASSDRTARIWDVKTGGVAGELTGHSLFLHRARFSPDGKLIATTSSDGTVRISDSASTQLIRILRTPSRFQYFMQDVAFGSDGHRMATASSERVARVWDTATGLTTAIIEGHSDVLRSISFAPDGRHVVTGSADKTARISRIYPTTQALADEAKRRVPRCLTRAQREAAFLDPEPPVWCIEMAKWPYQAEDWKSWLADKNKNLSPPLPDTPEWKVWTAARAR
jgi:WD40 repeat protein